MSRRLHNFRKTSMALASKSSRLHVVCDCDVYDEWAEKFYGTQAVVVHQDEIYLSWGTEGAEPDDIPGESVHWEFICNCNEPTPTPTCVAPTWEPMDYGASERVWWKDVVWESGTSGATETEVPSVSDSWVGICGDLPTPTPTNTDCCSGVRYRLDISTAASEYPLEVFDSQEEHDEFHASYLASNAPNKHCCAEYGNVEIIQKHGAFHDKIPEWSIDFICHDLTDISGDLMGTVSVRSYQDYEDYEDILVQHGTLGFSRKVKGEVIVGLNSGECIHGCVGFDGVSDIFVSLDESLDDCTRVEPEVIVPDECDCEGFELWEPRRYESDETVCRVVREDGIDVVRKYKAMPWEGTDPTDTPGRSIHWYEICARPTKFFFKVVSGNLTVGWDIIDIQEMCMGLFSKTITLPEESSRLLYSSGGYVHPIPEDSELYMNPRSEATNRYEEDEFTIDKPGQWAYSAGTFYRLVGRKITGVISCDKYKPIDCEVSDWFRWTECTKECDDGVGPGIQTRTRNIVTTPKYNGNPCPNLKDTRDCNPNRCPIDCVVSEWGAWSECDKSCGPGSRTRFRTIITDVQFGGIGCPDLSETEDCQTKPCPIPCEVSEWSDWSECIDGEGISRECGPSGVYLRRRTRSITTQPQHDAPPCPELEETESCEELPVCPVDCEVSDWDDWSECSAECGGGYRERKRMILAKNKGTGAKCPDLVETEQCNHEIPCPCDAECISVSGFEISHNWNGVYRRNVGDDYREYWQHEDLDNDKVVVWNGGSNTFNWDGKWVASRAPKTIFWGGFQTIDMTLDEYESRAKYCPYDPETIWHENANGDVPVVEVIECPVDCVPEPWSSDGSGWSECSEECGGGYKQRTRGILQPAISGGKECTEENGTGLTITEPCDQFRHGVDVPGSQSRMETPPCPCDAECICVSGFTEQSQLVWNGAYRKNLGNVSNTTGTDDPALNYREYWQNDEGKVINWYAGSNWMQTTGFWAGGGGIHTNWGRNTVATEESWPGWAGLMTDAYNDLPEYVSASRYCPYDPETVWKSTSTNKFIQPVVETCDCPVDCEVSDWSEWSACSQVEECGRGGLQTQTREILVHPNETGAKCPEVMEKTRICNRGPCPCESECIRVSGLTGTTIHQGDFGVPATEWNGVYRMLDSDTDLFATTLGKIRPAWRQIGDSGRQFHWTPGAMWAKHRDNGQWITSIVNLETGQMSWANHIIRTPGPSLDNCSPDDIFDSCWDGDGSSYEWCPWDEGTIYLDQGHGTPIIEKCDCPPEPTARFYADDIDESGTDSWVNSGENNDWLIDTPAGGSIQREDGSCGVYANFTGDTFAYTNFDLMGLYQPPPSGVIWAGKYWKNFVVSMIFEITDHPAGNITGTANSYYQSLFFRDGMVNENQYAYRLFYDRRTKNLVLGTSRKGCCLPNGNGFHQPGEISSAENSIELGVRYHAFCVFASTYFRLYLDGEFIDQFNLDRTWQDDVHPYAMSGTGTYIGSLPAGKPWYGGNLIGKIYEVELYSPMSFGPSNFRKFPIGFPWFEQEPNEQTLNQNGVSQWTNTWNNLLWPEMDENVKEHYEERQCQVK